MWIIQFFVNPEVYNKIFTDNNNEYDFVIVKAKNVDDVDSVENSVKKMLNKKDDKVFLSSVKKYVKWC